MHRRVPIIRLYRTLIVSIQIEISDDLLDELKDDIAHEIRGGDVQGLILEVSGVDVFDSYIARSVRDVARMCTLMGVRTALVGLDAAMAVTLVEMGMLLDGVETALNLETAVKLLGWYGEDVDDDLDAPTADAFLVAGGFDAF